MVFGVLLWAFTGFISPTAGETTAECGFRLKQLVQEAVAVEKSGSIVVPARVLKKNPMLLRNLIVAVYNSPFLTSFFQGFESAPLSIHYLPKGYDIPVSLAKLDAAGSYSFEELAALLKSWGKTPNRSFDLDFSKIDSEGLYLRFLDFNPQGRAAEKDKKLAQQFAAQFIKYVARQPGPIPIKSFTYVPAGKSQFLIESAFFVRRSYHSMREFVQNTLLMSQWKPFEDYHSRKFPQYTMSVQVEEPAGRKVKFSINLTQRRTHPREPSKKLYEVKIEEGSDGLLANEISIESSQVEWYRSEGRERVGMIALNDIGAAKKITVEFQTIGGRVQREVDVEVAK